MTKQARHSYAVGRTVATGGALSVGAVCCWAAQCGARPPVYTSSDVTPLPLVSVSGLNITTSRARTPTLLFVRAHLMTIVG